MSALPQATVVFPSPKRCGLAARGALSAAARPKEGRIDPRRVPPSGTTRNACCVGQQRSLDLVQNPFSGPRKGPDGRPCSRIKQAHDRSSPDPGGQRMVPHHVKMEAESYRYWVLTPIELHAPTASLRVLSCQRLAGHFFRPQPDLRRELRILRERIGLRRL